MKTHTFICRHCKTAMTSSDARYTCPKCGWRYFVDHEGSIIIEPTGEHFKKAEEKK